MTSVFEDNRLQELNVILDCQVNEPKTGAEFEGNAACYHC